MDVELRRQLDRYVRDHEEETLSTVVRRAVRAYLNGRGESN
jgi:metal-responsive CopG/Arc/MetJ family transcriptional regulator